MEGKVIAYVRVEAELDVASQPYPKLAELFDGLVGETLLNTPDQWGVVTGVKVDSGSISWREASHAL